MMSREGEGAGLVQMIPKATTSKYLIVKFTPVCRIAGRQLLSISGDVVSTRHFHRRLNL